MKRMLYIPLVSQQTLAGNAGFQEFFALSEILREQDEQVYWYVVMPSWVTDGLRGHDRMQYVYVDNTRDHGVNDVVGFPAFELAQYFGRRGGRFIVDGVLTNCVSFSAYASQLLSDPVRKKLVPMFVRDHDEGELRGGFGLEDRGLNLANSYVSCHTGIQSDAERALLSRYVTSRTNASMTREFMNKSFLWPMGYDLDDVDKHVGIAAQEKASSDMPVFFCGGDFDIAKNRRHELEVARRLFALSKTLVMVASRSQRHKFDRVLPKGDRSFVGGVGMGMSVETYRRTLAKCHLFVSVSDIYSVGSGEEEIGRLLYGQVGVFPHKEWAINRLGPDYPFYYNHGNYEEATALAEWIIDHYPDAVRRVEPVVERLRKEQGIDLTVNMAWQSMKDCMDEHYHITAARKLEEGQKEPLFHTIYKVAKGLGDEFALDVFLDVMEEYLPWLKPWGRKGSLKVIGDVPLAIPTLYDLREMLDNLGWVDTCEGPNIMVRREREPLPGVHIERLENE